MKLTMVADEMVQRLGKIHTAEYLAAVMNAAKLDATAQGLTHIATAHIEAAMEEMADPMAPDYAALAAEELTSQNGDSRDAAEVAG